MPLHPVQTNLDSAQNRASPAELTESSSLQAPEPSIASIELAPTTAPVPSAADAWFNAAIQAKQNRLVKRANLTRFKPRQVGLLGASKFDNQSDETG